MHSKSLEIHYGMVLRMECMVVHAINHEIQSSKQKKLAGDPCMISLGASQV